MTYLKQLSFILLLLNIPLLSIAQTIYSDFEMSEAQITSLNDDLGVYFSSVKAADYEKVLDMIHPDVVAFMSHDAMIKQFEQAMSNPAYNATFSDEKILNIHHAFSGEKTDYVFVDYELKTNFHFIRDEGTTDKDFQLYVDFMESAFKNQFKNAAISKKENTVIVAEKKTLLASKNQNNSWKFADYALDMGPLYEMIFSKELVAKMNSCLE
jgi:hypothetical protein